MLRLQTGSLRPRICLAGLAAPAIAVLRVRAAILDEWVRCRRGFGLSVVATVVVDNHDLEPSLHPWLRVADLEGQHRSLGWLEMASSLLVAYYLAPFVPARLLSGVLTWRRSVGRWFQLGSGGHLRLEQDPCYEYKLEYFG